MVVVEISDAENGLVLLLWLTDVGTRGLDGARTRLASQNYYYYE
jgi:hypothetical protein